MCACTCACNLTMSYYSCFYSYVHDCVATCRNYTLETKLIDAPSFKILLRSQHSALCTAFYSSPWVAQLASPSNPSGVTPAFLARHGVILRKYKEWAANECGPPPSQGPQGYARDCWEFPSQHPCPGGSEPISCLPSWQQLPKVWPLACLP